MNKNRGKILVAQTYQGPGFDDVTSFLKDLPTSRLLLRKDADAIVENVRPFIAKHEAFLYLGPYFTRPGDFEQVNLRMNSGQGLTAHDLFTQRYDLHNVTSVVLYYGGLTREERESDEPSLPIQRGFLTAGANQVATFLWRLDKGSLSRVLKGIYSDFISQGHMPPNNIFTAQSRLLKDPLTSHPYFWAGFLTLALTE